MSTRTGRLRSTQDRLDHHTLPEHHWRTNRTSAEGPLPRDFHARVGHPVTPFAAGNVTSEILRPELKISPLFPRERQIIERAARRTRGPPN